MFEVGEQRFGGKFTQFHSAVIPQLCLVTFVSHIAQIINLQWQTGIWAKWLTHKSKPGLAFQTTSFLYSSFFYVLLTTDGAYSSFSHLFYHFIYITNLFFYDFNIQMNYLLCSLFVDTVKINELPKLILLLIYLHQREFSI